MLGQWRRAAQGSGLMHRRLVEFVNKRINDTSVVFGVVAGESLLTATRTCQVCNPR